jgi:hypothetical protein
VWGRAGVGFKGEEGGMVKQRGREGFLSFPVLQTRVLSPSLTERPPLTDAFPPQSHRFTMPRTTCLVPLLFIHIFLLRSFIGSPR